MSSSSTPEKEFVIVGGGIAGLVLAMALQTHCGITPEVFEQAPGFGDGVGGAIGMYGNGLRVIRDISDTLLDTIRQAGYPYIYRRWYRHDGTEVACAEERHLTPTEKEDDELSPIGIRRWKLQKILYEASVASGVPVHFNKILEKVAENDGTYILSFADKTTVTAKYVFGCDGVKSKVRDAVVGFGEEDPEYTGVTCLMGAAPIPRPVRGICFPSSQTSRCHMCTYPTGPEETIFQIYFPTPVENPEAWGALNGEKGQQECSELADRLTKDGWDDQFVAPLRQAAPGSVVRVGLRARDPVTKWVHGNMVLLGDAAHPPVPYIGQGAMMAIEDAGTLALLLKNFTVDRFEDAMKAYQDLRLPRTAKILGSSKDLGKTQQMRADNWWYNLTREWTIKIQVALNGTLPIMKPGATFDYRQAVEQTIQSGS